MLNLNELFAGLSLEDRRISHFFIMTSGDQHLFASTQAFCSKRSIDAKFVDVEWNTGWLKATNLGISHCPTNQHVVLMNDDVLVSENMFTNMNTILDSCPDIGVLAPCYNDIYSHQHTANKYNGLPMGFTPASPAPLRQVGFVDGTCMAMNAKEVLMLNEVFLPSGWGADIDLCIRSKRLGKKVAVTESAYLFHKKAETARRIYGSMEAYIAAAGLDMDRAAIDQYGSIDNFRLDAARI